MVTFPTVGHRYGYILCIAPITFKIIEYSHIPYCKMGTFLSRQL